MKNQNVQLERDPHFGQDSFKSRLSDLANKHTECQIRTLHKPKIMFSISKVHAIFGAYLY